MECPADWAFFFNPICTSTLIFFSCNQVARVDFHVPQKLDPSPLTPPALHCKINVVAAGVTGHDLNLVPSNAFAVLG